MIRKKDYYRNILLICLAFDDENGSNVEMDYDECIQNSNSILSFIDKLTEAFCQYGLRENDEPNACGIILEDTIDYFNNLLYDLEFAPQK